MNTASMPEVRVYTTRFCGYCIAAKRLLRARGIEYIEIDVTGDQASRAWLVESTGRRTVPQIFVNGKPIGGYQELAALDRSGRLAAMLQEPAGNAERDPERVAKRPSEPPER